MGIAQTGVVGDDAHVGEQSQRHAQADGVTVDGSDNRLWAQQHVLEQTQCILRHAQGVFQAIFGLSAFGHLLDVAAGRKGAAGAGQDDGLDRFVTGQIDPDMFQFPVVVRTDGIELVGIVHGDYAHAVIAGFDLDEGILAVVDRFGEFIHSKTPEISCGNTKLG